MWCLIWNTVDIIKEMLLKIDILWKQFSFYLFQQPPPQMSEVTIWISASHLGVFSNVRQSFSCVSIFQSVNSLPKQTGVPLLHWFTLPAVRSVEWNTVVKTCQIHSVTHKTADLLTDSANTELKASRNNKNECIKTTSCSRCTKNLNIIYHLIEIWGIIVTPSFNHWNAASILAIVVCQF